MRFFLRQYPHNKYKSRELCARATVIYGNYIRVDTTTGDKKNYFIDDNTDNNSASPTLLAAKEYKNQQLALAFGNRIALTNDHVVVRATDASALPKNHRFSGAPNARIVRRSRSFDRTGDKNFLGRSREYTQCPKVYKSPL